MTFWRLHDYMFSVNVTARSIQLTAEIFDPHRCCYRTVINWRDPSYCLAPGVVINFDPVTYAVTEGGSTMLRIVRVGDADIPVSVSVSTVVGTAGDYVIVQCLLGRA